MNEICTIGNNNLTVVNSHNVTIHITQLQQQNKIPHYLTHSAKIENFEGREEYFQEINSHFGSEDSLILASGEPGIGKTAIAQEYVKRFDKGFAHIIWLNCLSNIPSAFLNSNIDKELNLSFDPNLSIEKRFELLTIALKNIEGNNILVLDNVDDHDEIIEYYKKGVFNLNTWKVLITTRTLPFFFPSQNILKVDLLKMSEAINLFHKLYTHEQPCTETYELLDLIDRHTLTLEILARNLQKLYLSGYNLKNMYEDLTAGILRFPKSNPVQINYNRTNNKIELYPLLNAVFSATNNSPNERYMLSLFSILPSIEVSYATLKELIFFNTENPDKEFDEILNSLMEKGWISTNLKMHKITQEVIREQLKPDIESFENAVRYLTKKIEVNYNEGDFLEKGKWIDYVVHFSSKIFGINENLINLKSHLGSLYRDLGNYNDAIETLRDVHNVALNILPKDNITLAWLKSNLGLALWSHGDFVEAEPILIQALEIKLKQLNEETIEVATTQNNLGITYIYLGKLFKAKELLEKALKTDTRHFGYSSGIVTMDMNNLGRVYQDLGLYDDAIDMYIKALEIDHNLYKPDKSNPNFAYRWSNLGSVYLDYGKYSNEEKFLWIAKDYIEKATDLNIRHFGRVNGDSSKMLTNLGEVHRSLQEFGKAKEILEDALELKIEIFGNNNAQIFPTINYLALLYSDLSKFSDAINILEDSLKITLDQTLNNQNVIARHYEDLGMIYFKSNEMEKTKNNILKAIEYYKVCFEGKHPKINKLSNFLNSLH